MAEMQAGRELDALVATRVLDHVVIRWAEELPIGYALTPGQHYPAYLDGTFAFSLPYYSTDIAAAWQVVEKMTETHHWRVVSPFEPGEPWHAGLTPHGVTGWNGRPDIERAASTAPQAICEAALAVLGVEAN